MSVEELKEATLQVIRQAYEETGKPSSLKRLYEKVDGLNNRNFYKIFESVEQAHERADVPYDKSRRDKMKKVRKKRVTKSAKKEKQVDNSSSLELMDPSASPQLSKDIMRCLYDMQGVMGAPSISGAIKQAYQNEVSTAKFRVTHWPTYSDAGEEFTTEAMVQKLLNYIDYQESELKDALKFARETEVELENLVEAIKESVEERYEAGYDDGKNKYALLVPCTICGQPITLEPGTESHRLIIEVLREYRIVHTDCEPKYQRIYAH